METLIGSAALVVGLTLLWTGRRRLAVSSFQATLFSIIDVAGFIVSVVALGWIGVAIFIAVSTIAVIAWSIVLAMKKQSILVNAAVQGDDVSVTEAEEIWQWMGEEESFAALPPLKRAELIGALAAKARKPAEIRAMAVPIAQLALIFGCNPGWLAPRFDQLLRLSGHDAPEATEVADTLTRSTQLAAASFEEMIEAMLSDEGPTDEADDTADTASQHNQFQENLRATTELQIRQDGQDGVRLNGGPLDGWLVLKDAPSLAADWHKTWPPTVATQHSPGRYELAHNGTWAEWVPLEQAME